MRLQSYRADIDGLRALAVLSVLGYHFFPHVFKSGFVGVDIFFVISGYLISSIILKDLEIKKFSIREFYKRRILRLFPALSIVLLFSLVVGLVFLSSVELKQLSKHGFYSTMYITNYSLANETGYFDTNADFKPLLHLWSLAVEEQFYFIWPIVLVFIRTKIKFYFACLILIVFSLYRLIDNPAIFHEYGYFLPQYRIWALLAGSLLAYQKSKVVDFKQFAFTKGVKYQDYFFVILIIVSIFFDYTKRSFFLCYMFAVLAAIIIVISNGGKVNKVLSNPILTYIGNISYPLYLWHWPLLAFYRIQFQDLISITGLIFTLALSFLFAILTYEYIEKPVKYVTFKHKVPALVSVMMFLSTSFLYIYQQNGLPKRYPQNTMALQQLKRTPKVDSECYETIFKVLGKLDYCKVDNFDGNEREIVVIYGDSHAHALYPGLKNHFFDQKKSVILLAGSACPLVPDVSVGRIKPLSDKCRKQAKIVSNWVANNHNITTVVLVLRGQIYIDGIGFGAAEKYQRNLQFNSEGLTSQQAYLTGLQRLINLFKQKHKVVAIITENPELGFHAFNCIARPISNRAPSCSISLSAVLSRQKTYRETIAQLKDVSIFDSLPFLCSDDKCFGKLNGVLLYADDDHLSVQGSYYLINQFIKNADFQKLN